MKPIDMTISLTAVNAITPIGYTAPANTSAVRAGISALNESYEFWDVEGNPITCATIDDISYEADISTRINSIAKKCLENLFLYFFPIENLKKRNVYFLLGVAHKDRPGLYYEEEKINFLKDIRDLTSLDLCRSSLQLFRQGNASSIYAIATAKELLYRDPESVCIVGGVDTLMDEETLEWFEETERLKSETYGRHHGLIPGEGVAFLVLETAEMAKALNMPVLAQIKGTACSLEPFPFLSSEPSKGVGLTRVCREVLKKTHSDPRSIHAVLCDLDGEFFRAKEWSFTELRCFGDCNEKRQLWHPAEYYGNIGAASGAVLLSVVATSRGWLNGLNLVFCSDDFGARGAVIIEKNWSGNCFIG